MLSDLSKTTTRMRIMSRHDISNVDAGGGRNFPRQGAMNSGYSAPQRRQDQDFYMSSEIRHAWAFRHTHWEQTKWMQ
jgi:hypothetical protein